MPKLRRKKGQDIIAIGNDTKLTSANIKNKTKQTKKNLNHLHLQRMATQILMNA